LGGARKGERYHDGYIKGGLKKVALTLGSVWNKRDPGVELGKGKKKK